jgi:hypothetical protein
MRDEYQARKEQDLAALWQRYEQLKETAENQLSHDQVLHAKELGDAFDKLREAERQLNYLRDVDDDEWADLRTTFEKVESELRFALDRSEWRLDHIADEGSSENAPAPHVG